MSSEDCAMAGVNEPATIGTETPVTVSARPVAAPSRRRRTKDRSVIFWSPWAIESKDATAGTPDSSRTYYRQAERQPNCLGGMPPQLNRQSAGFARLGAEGQRLALGIPAERADRRGARGLNLDQRAVVDAHDQHATVRIAHRDDGLMRMAGHHHHTRLGARHDFWLPAHWAVLAVERPQDELLGARGGEEVAVHGPAERAHARRIARHAHVLALGQPPAVQHRLLHGGDQEFAVRAERRAEMRALPFQRFRLSRGIGKPKRGAVVMRDT